MNVSASSVVAPARGADPLISDHVTPYILMVLSFLILLFSLPATVLNLLNIIVFMNMGTIDSITVCFISLSLFDFISMLIKTINALLSLFVDFGAPWSRDFHAYVFVLNLAYSIAMDWSSSVTTYIALQRGLCVALPFLTRHMFNRNRSLAILVIVFTLLLACAMPRSTFIRLQPIPDPMVNSSQMLMIRFLEPWKQFDSFYIIFVKTILVCIEYVVMVVCSVAISLSMRSSIQLKLYSSTLSSQPQPNDSQTPEGRGKSKPYTNKTQMNDDREVTAGTTATKRDGPVKKKDTKEVLVVKQSLTVVIVHVVLNTPRMLAIFYKVIEPRYQIGGQFNNLFFVVFTAINVCDAINATVNFFVYVKFNSKFRLYLAAVSHRHIKKPI